MITNQVFDMDALELLSMLPDNSIDMGLFDLPYGVTACKWDTIIDIDAMWEQLKRIAKPKAALVFTATQPFSSRLVSSNYKGYRSSWVWNKGRAVGFQIANVRQLMKHEDILVFGYPSVNYYPQKTKRNKLQTPPGAIKNKLRLLSNNLIPKSNDLMVQFPTSIIEFNSSDNTNKLHPTQKPVALFEYLIKTYTMPNEIVLDITCGSGTTGIACTNLDRRYILNDNGVSEKTGRLWADIARDRIQAHDPTQDTLLSNGSKQLSLFTDNRG